MWPRLLLASCCCLLQLLGSVKADVSGAISPIIGVLAQEVYPDALMATKFNATSYIAASYVKFVEGAGGRVVPIWIGRKRSYYENLLQKLNGVLLPGGGTFFNETDGYGDAGEHIVQVAKELNDNGTYFPIWGTCLGMELLVLKMSNNTETRSYCYSVNQALPLEFKPDYNESRLFAGASELLIRNWSEENITFNNHRYCYTEESFDQPPLKGNWQIMSLSYDKFGVQFVSTLEHRKYPFYGVQFHPEQPLYEFVKASVPHTVSAVHGSQYFADFFINEARRNPHVFQNATEQAQCLIYNYNPKYTSTVGALYIQQYLFDSKSATYLFEVDPEIPEPDDGDDDTHYYPYNKGGTASKLTLSFGLVFAAFASSRVFAA